MEPPAPRDPPGTLEARDQAIETAVLQASAEGVRVDERLGFRAFGEIKPAT